jgi:hypothetical protein
MKHDRVSRCILADAAGPAANKIEFAQCFTTPMKPDITANARAGVAVRLGNHARDCGRQVAELQVRFVVLNVYTALGIPVTVAVG